MHGTIISASYAHETPRLADALRMRLHTDCSKANSPWPMFALNVLRKIRSEELPGSEFRRVLPLVGTTGVSALLIS